jgi:undecaprenyl-diphosphatase
MAFLEQIDQQLFLFLNGFHNPFWDQVMYWISYKFTWIPLYLSVLIYLIVKQKKYAYISILLLVLAAILADQMSVNLFKNVFLRYRPCHNLDIQPLVHLVNEHCGGQYGFVSSHATNSFAFAILSALIINKRNISILLVVWAIVVSYSRIYLGVHYPADILGGAILGTGIAILLHFVYQQRKQKLKF